MLYLPRLDIWGLIFEFLPPVDLIHFGRTNKAAYMALTDYSIRAFDIRRLLLPYFSEEDIKSFQQLQLFTGTVISGSTALQLFERTTYPGSDLDIYVEQRYCREVVWWLTSRGYIYRPRPTQPASFNEAIQESTPAPDNFGYLGRGMSNVFDFIKYGSERKIQLVTAFRCPLEIILDYHSTCVMNVITHDTAYSLYPYATFQQRRSLICGGNRRKQDEAREKYRRRGWEMESRLDVCEMVDRRSDFSLRRRWVGDEYCWRISLCVEERLAEGLVRNRITSNSWNIQHEQDESRMSFSNYKSCHLRFQYICGGNDIVQVFRLALADPSVDDDELNKKLHPHIL